MTPAATLTPLRAEFPEVEVHERLLDGSASQASIHRADCPVAVVRDTDDEISADVVR